MQCNDRSEKTPWFPGISITSISFPVHEELHSIKAFPRWARMLATMYSSRSRLPRSVILSGELIKGVTRSEWKPWVLRSVVCSQVISLTF